MIEEFTVQHEDGRTRGRYVVYLPDGIEAELTYRKRDETTLIADHTFVPPSFRGRGLAENLVGTLIADARRQSFKIEPLCSYVAAQFRRHPEWADLRA